MSPSERPIDIHSSLDASSQGWLRQKQPQLQPPGAMVFGLARVARLRIALALTAPIVAGVALGWWQSGSELQTMALIFVLVGSFASAIGLNLLTEFYDYRRSLMISEQLSHDEPITGFDLLVSGKVSPGFAHSMGLLALVLSGLCLAWAAVLSGWPIAFFATLSLLLTCTYCAPPVNYSHRSWGLGEIGIWLNFGLLHTFAGYFSQAHTLTWSPFWLSLPLGLLAALCVHNFNFVYHRRDWLLRKRTLVVQFGSERAVDLSTVFVVAAYVVILLTASFGLLPLRALIMLVALPTAISAFAELDREGMDVDDGMTLAHTTANATLLTALLFAFILILDRL